MPSRARLESIMQPAIDWFASRGWMPFDYQLRTWAAYLAGESGLVDAPTGTGKSYAVWLGPVMEWLGQAGASLPLSEPTRRHRRNFRRNSPPLQVLWITPLRALANDTVQAMRAPLEALGLPWSVELRTGDASATLRKQQRDRLPTALVTTPESLSLQLSYADARERLRTLRCVIVDEWHELLGTKRGVQTELALARLRRWNPELRVWGLSATIGNIEEARDVLLGGRAAAGRLIHAEMPKCVEVVTLCPPEMERFPWAGHLGMKLLPDVLRLIESARSTLLFTNTRSQAELWFQGILRERPDLIGHVALHHGSLDRTIRGRVEAMLAEGRLRCVVCTSSLDLGVDFTPVDQVIQVGSPKGVARLLQRAGRSGHQPGALSKIMGVPTHAFELVEFAAARDAMARRDIEARVPLDRPLDVLVQHLVTVALGGGFDGDELLAEVRTAHAFRNLTAEQWQWALDFVVQGGPALHAYPQYCRVAFVNGRYEVVSRSIARLHRLSIGTITGESAMSVQVIGGRKLGTIEEGFIARLRPGDRFVFAGNVLELATVRDMTAWVRRSRDRRGAVPKWMGGRMPLSTQLAAAVRAKLSVDSDDHGAEPEMRAIRPLLDVQARWSKIPEPDELLIEQTHSREGHHTFVLPFEGRLVHEGLAPLLAWRIARTRPISITTSATDYGFELLASEALPDNVAFWHGLLDPQDLLDDLLACLNSTELARRQFRDIARVAGLVIQGFPGARKPLRHIQASSELFFEVFREYDPGNLLLDQARREVLDQQLEIRRLRATLERVARLRITVLQTERLSPLAFPIWAERLRASHVTSESWSERIGRMVLRLEKAASQPERKGRRRAASRVGR